jgi:hypothetical protein
MFVTKVFRFGCYSFNLTTQMTERLTNIFGVAENEINSVLTELNKTYTTWSFAPADFELKRDAAWFVDLNGKSIIKNQRACTFGNWKSSIAFKRF